MFSRLETIVESHGPSVFSEINEYDFKYNISLKSTHTLS